MTTAKSPDARRVGNSVRMTKKAWAFVHKMRREMEHRKVKTSQGRALEAIVEYAEYAWDYGVDILRPKGK